MTTSEIRNKFLNFFKDKQHKIIESYSLVPSDPTLLFTNAGMVQFKDFFAGNKQSPYSKIATCQKCLRISGKHNDIENIGYSVRHHTFFEMLGNFSFGNYFKEEAIKLAWKFLTIEMKISPLKLWITVHTDDKETYEIWVNKIGILPERIIKTEKNFWEMGDTGPCGPCSEIIFDYGENIGCKENTCNPECECGRFLELWNLVFIEYNRSQDGMFLLPNKNIDTGMSLERLSSVIQNVKNNYEIDSIKPIIASIEKLSSCHYENDKEKDIAMRIIADHIRAICFLIAEGIIPSNQEKGYVLRRIIRRAIIAGSSLNLKEPFLYKLVNIVADLMKDAYPILITTKENIVSIILAEERKFKDTLEIGIIKLKNILKKSKHKILQSEDIFKMYDTYGIPFEVIKEIAKGFILDETGFEQLMDEQKTKGRLSFVKEELLTCYEEYEGIVNFKDEKTLETYILRIIKDKQIIDLASENEEIELILQDTPFYGEAGGQIGDKGIIQSDVSKIEINDTKKINDVIVHYGKVISGKIKTNEKVKASINNERRQLISINHTATHLLHSALRKILGSHIQQKGSYVGDDKLRFDFFHTISLSKSEINKIENLVNEYIRKNEKVDIITTNLETAKRIGAIALFNEKYKEEVRIVKIGEISLELCGGTHLNYTGEIGLFKIIQETSIGSSLRRIEAITSKTAYNLIKEKEEILEEIAILLKTDNIIKKLNSLILENKEKEKIIKKFQEEKENIVIQKMLDEADNISDIKLIIRKFKDYDIAGLRIIGDKIINKLDNGIVILLSIKNNQAFFICKITKNLTCRFHAGKIIEKLASYYNGKGGGNNELGQGGSKSFKELNFEVDKIKKILDIEKY